MAVKTEKTKRRFSQLQLEYRFYRRFGRNRFTPEVFYYCTTPRFNAIVMELLGPSLEEMFVYNGQKITDKTVVLLAMQIIKIFDFVHQNGIVYRDVKPQNFLLSLNIREGRVYIVDFGLSKQYINPLTQSHQPYAENISLTGTARYMSINTHLGREQSRRDDLESVGHMLIYFLRGKLPWQGLSVPDAKNPYALIGKVKSETPIDKLCEGVPKIFGQYLAYCRGLNYFQRPDYDYIFNLFSMFYSQENFKNNLFDWKIPNEPEPKRQNPVIKPLTPCPEKMAHELMGTKRQSFSYPSLVFIDSTADVKPGFLERDMRQLKHDRHVAYQAYVLPADPCPRPQKSSSAINFFYRICSCFKFCLPKSRKSNSIKVLSTNSHSCDYF